MSELNKFLNSFVRVRQSYVMYKEIHYCFHLFSEPMRLEDFSIDDIEDIIELE